MINFSKLIDKANLLNDKRGGAKESAILALRYFQAYSFSEEADKKVFLQKANYTAISAHRRNAAHIDIYCLSIYISIHAGFYDSANEMLDRAFAYRTFFKTNEPFYYGVLCFLYALLEICQKRTRSAKKHWRALSLHAKNALKDSDFAIMQGLLFLASEDYQEAFNSFNYAYSFGGSNIFLLEGMFHSLRLAAGGDVGLPVLPVLIYAAKRGANIYGIADKFRDNLLAACETHPGLGKKLYNISGYVPILSVICKKLMQDGDLSKKAYGFYKEAESKQVVTTGLYKWIVVASFANNAERINRYTMAQFLSENPEMETPLAIYVYHKLLTDPKLFDLLPNSASKILKLGAICLERNIVTRQSLAILHYFWKRCKALGITGVDVDLAESHLSEKLTLFLLEADSGVDITCVYVTDPEIKGMTYAEMDTENNTAIVSAVGKNTSYASISTGKRINLNKKLKVYPMLETADIDLYQYFFARGDRRVHLLCFITNYYLDMAEIPDESVAVFEATVAEKSITKAYKNRILAALGKLHYNAFSFSEALNCYSQIDYETLEDEFVPKILEIYLKTKEYPRAANLLSKKSMFVPMEELFLIATQILTKSGEGSKITDVCYNLLVAGYYSDELLANVLENFKGALVEWTLLAKAFDEDNRHSPKLDAIVLEMALGLSNFDPGVQQAFVRLANSEYGKINSKQLNGFINLAAYEMLTKETLPEYDVLVFLEKTCLQGGEHKHLLWGLACAYAKNSITTLKSDEIFAKAIDSLKTDRVLFPIFKDLQSLRNPFVEKYEPLVYKTAPGKDCFVYYKTSETDGFYSKKMTYVRFGIYVAIIPLFYNENLEYYFSEETKGGSVTTPTSETRNKKPFFHEDESDVYYAINNAVINEQMFKHERVEEIVTKLVKEVIPVRAKLL